MSTVQERIDRGREARRFLESPVFTEVMKDAEREFVDNWLNQQKHDEKVALANWASVQALAQIESSIRRIANEGLMEEEKLKRQK